MKASIGAGILLILIMVLVILNACFVHAVSQDMSRQIEDLSETPNEKDLADIRYFQKNLEEKLPFLRQTISFSQLDRVSELSTTLYEYAESGALSDYRVTKALLLDAIEDMSRLERLFQKATVGNGR